MRNMTIRPIRLLAAIVAVLALAVPGTALAATKAVGADRGVVQSVDATHIVLRPLDGSTVTFDITPRTRVRLNGRNAPVAALGPGLVAEVTADRKHRAIVIRAFGTPAVAQAIDRGTVTGVTRTSVTIAVDGGGSVTVPLDGKTKVRGAGSLGRRKAIRPGAVVAVTHLPGGPALVVTIVKRTGK
jgi:hypothetical protein